MIKKSLGLVDESIFREIYKNFETLNILKRLLILINGNSKVINKIGPNRLEIFEKSVKFLDNLGDNNVVCEEIINYYSTSNTKNIYRCFLANILFVNYFNVDDSKQKKILENIDLIIQNNKDLLQNIIDFKRLEKYYLINENVFEFYSLIDKQINFLEIFNYFKNDDGLQKSFKLLLQISQKYELKTSDNNEYEWKTIFDIGAKGVFQIFFFFF